MRVGCKLDTENWCRWSYYTSIPMWSLNDGWSRAYICKLILPWMNCRYLLHKDIHKNCGVFFKSTLYITSLHKASYKIKSSRSSQPSWTSVVSLIMGPSGKIIQSIPITPFVFREQCSGNRVPGTEFREQCSRNRFPGTVFWEQIMRTLRKHPSSTLLAGVVEFQWDESRGSWWIWKNSVPRTQKV